MIILAATMLLAALQEPVARRMPPEMHDAPPVAVDHTAVVAVETNFGGSPAHQFEMARRGGWIRETRRGEGRATSISHADLSSGVSLSYGLDADGRFTHLSVSRHPSTDSYHRYRRVATGARDRALGETCFVWKTERVDDDYQGSWLTCETRDGIQLWTRVTSPLGSLHYADRTVSFQRRRVLAAEVAPTDDLLRWDRWSVMAPPAASAPRPGDYEVLLEGAVGPTARREIRIRGDWSYQSDILRSGETSVLVNNGVVSWSSQQEADGRPLRLQIYRLPPEQRVPRQSYVPVQPVEAGNVLGEDCTYSNSYAGPNVMVVTSGTNRVCVTRDDIPLRIFSRHRWVLADLTAIALSRQSPPLSAFAPPAPVLSWAAWGVAD